MNSIAPIEKQGDPSARDRSVFSARHDFPVLYQKRNKGPTNDNHQIIYLDSASVMQCSWPVIQRMNAWFVLENSLPVIGGHYLNDTARTEYEGARVKVADFLGVKSDNIIFTSGVQDSISRVADFVTKYTTSPKVAISDLEHEHNILPWVHRNIPIETFEIDKDGQDPEIKLRTIESSNTIVSMTARSHVLGLDPVWQYFSRQCLRKGILFHLDASQWVGHEPLDLQGYNVDFVSFSGQNIYGPPGIGVLYVSDAVKKRFAKHCSQGQLTRLTLNRDGEYNPKYQELPHGAEIGEPNVVGVIGLGTAIDHLKKWSWDSIKDHEANLSQKFVEGLRELNFKVIGPETPRVIVSFNHEEVAPDDVADQLSEKGIFVGHGTHSAQPLMKKLDLMPTGTVRVSFGVYNSTDDVDAILSALKEVG